VTKCAVFGAQIAEDPGVMFNRDPRHPSAQIGTIDFEYTDLQEARAAHAELPPGVAEFGCMQPGFWERRRRRPLATDRALTGASLEWLMQLPPALRPTSLRDRYPRIVNAISDSWADAVRSLETFEHLLDDRRTGRRGFAADVRHEIESLCEHRLMLVRMPPAP
jgi:hypothetical protein